MGDFGEPLETIKISVLGEPSPEGSTRSYYIPKLNRTITKHQNQKSLDAWRNRVATEAQRALEGSKWVSDGSSAYEVNVDFIITRPPSVPSHKRIHPVVKPDIDKLIRAINDALTGILFPDDCQVITMRVTKDYSDDQRPGAYIEVSRYANQIEKAGKGRKKASAKAVSPEESPCDDPRDD